MQFSTGQVVVHPHHGPATVTDIATRTIKNEQRHYLGLAIHHTTLTISVPMANAEVIGVRPVMSVEAVAELVDVLVAPSGQEDSAWSRRMKADVDRLRTGDAHTIAGLVRDLTRRQQTKGLSLGEKDLLRDARQPLVAELALALGVTEHEAGAAVDAAVLEGTKPAAPVELAAAG